MSTERFTELFAQATDGGAPYPYQVRWAVRGDSPQLLRVPTGAGKTATAVLGWVYKWQTQPETTPRRLVYCLPMRVLVEQTRDEVLTWLHRLNLLDAPAEFDPTQSEHRKSYLPRFDDSTREKVAVHVLMGGEDAVDWDLHPERHAVLIGTQDMLLSRALNRGYAASRFHWPIDFGLLNNDCLWVFDEPQLMTSGVSTSAQLAGFRATLDTFHNTFTVWMSATLEPDWLNTIDFRGRITAALHELDDEDYDPCRPLLRRMAAEKTLASLNVLSTKDMKDVAKAVLGGNGRAGTHRPGTQTLLIVNTVERAKTVYDELQKLRKKSATPGLLLIHSRFRPTERRQLNDSLLQEGVDRIIVATQVVEAGVDISAHTLVTELAPWSNLVQRMGRCNRTGNDGPGQVYWIDLGDKATPPYSPDDLSFAREQLRKLNGQSVAPRDLDGFKVREQITLPFEHKHVIRRRDLLDLFDTAPDLSGNDIDIQRYVRGDDPEVDVQVFWRSLEGGPPSVDEPAPLRDELCSVPLGQLRDFLESRAEKRRTTGYAWDHLDAVWCKVEPKYLRPGMIVLLPTNVGGYHWNESSQSGKGWDIGSEAPVLAVDQGNQEMPTKLEEGAASDVNSALAGSPLTIADHTNNVCRELADLLHSLNMPDPWRDHLMQAARWHDLGKAHWAFQQGMRSANPSLPESQLWAKSGKQVRLKHGRKYFRHELASALTALQHGLPFIEAYLIASHHGRVRLAIRALPGEEMPDAGDTLCALGVQHGDSLPEIDLGGQKCPAISLDLTPMQLGGESSWTANALKLLGELGPFRLAFLESLLRVADVRASKKEASHDRS